MRNPSWRLLGSRITKIGISWAAIKFAFFLGGLCMALYMGAVIFAVTHYGAEATAAKVHSITGGVL